MGTQTRGWLAGDVGWGGEGDWEARWGDGERESEGADDGDAEGEEIKHVLGREDVVALRSSGVVGHGFAEVVAEALVT